MSSISTTRGDSGQTGRTGARHLAARDYSRLSDGERQRVMIARALAQEPTVLVLELALRTADTVWLIRPDGRLDAASPGDMVADGRIDNAFNRSRDFEASVEVLP
jgi:iron complex transport system ATP-binding protein